ncbi:hypothetical protein HK405_002482, partial [Cladochytrium tenue]
DPFQLRVRIPQALLDRARQEKQQWRFPAPPPPRPPAAPGTTANSVSGAAASAATGGGGSVVVLSGVLPAAPVGEIKERLAQLTGMPAARQKLTLCERRLTARTVLRDAASAAYYNLCAGDVVELGVRERGGAARK